MTTYGPRTSNMDIRFTGYPTYRKATKVRSWYVQRPITSAPLPFTVTASAFVSGDFQRYLTLYGSIDSPNEVPAVSATAAIGGMPTVGSKEWKAWYAYNYALQKALSRFKDKCYSAQSQWAVNMAEYGQAVDMIVKPARTLLRAAKALRSGDVVKFVTELGIEKRRRFSDDHIARVGKKFPLRAKLMKAMNNGKRYFRAKQASDVWLAYHFGWEPMLADIHAGIEILQQEYTSMRIKATANWSSSYEEVPIHLKNGYTFKDYFGDCQGKCLIQAVVHVTNPNLHRATSLGLVNPISVVWELVPFSFVLDWFIPVGQFLDSFTNYFGLEFSRQFNTRSIYISGTKQSYLWRTNLWNNDTNGWGAWDKSPVITCEAYRLTRALSFPSMTWPLPKVFKGFSVVRGATAIALLVNALPSV